MFCAQGPSVVRRNRAHRGKTEPFQRTRQIRRCQQFAKHRHSRQKCSIISHVGVCPTQTTARGHTPSITAAKRLERNQNPSRIRGNIATTNTGEDHQADTGLVRQWWNAHGQPGGENLAAPSQRLKVSVPRLSVNFQSQTISAFNGNMLTGLSFGLDCVGRRGGSFCCLSRWPDPVAVLKSGSQHVSRTCPRGAEGACASGMMTGPHYF